MENENNLSLVKRKSKKIGVILLVIILLVTVAVSGFMLGIKYANKDNSETTDDNNDITNDDDSDAENDAPETPITKVEIANFLSLAVNGDQNYDLLMVENDDNSDESIFIKVIKYLVANNIYTKSDDIYIFNQSDIKEVARKYLMKENFDYHSTNQQFPYDSTTQTVSSKIQFCLFTGYSAIVTKKIEEYSVDGKEINVDYKVTVADIYPENGGIGPEITYSYTITLEKTDTELKIINVVNN